MGSVTIGIDLSAQPRDTACCVLEWDWDSARVTLLDAGFDNGALLDLVEAHQPTKLAIDSPFGWPREFSRAITDFTATGRWPDSDDRRPLLFRTTDLFVREVTGTDPLSVSSNLLAICAMRCARLLNLLSRGGPLDRTGSALVVEVYPAAALRQWGLDPRGYKGAKPERKERRRMLVEQIAADTEAWLRLGSTAVEALRSSDHLLDALLSAVVGRAVEVGQALPIPKEHREAASAEGWIQLPRQQPLAELELIDTLR